MLADNNTKEKHMTPELKDKVDVLIYNARMTVDNFKYCLKAKAGMLPKPVPRKVTSLLNMIDA
jgi:hypothetical protein